MQLTPTTFVQQLSAEHDITRDHIVLTKIVHSLVKKYGERVLISDIVKNITMDKELVDYISFLKNTGLLSVSSLSTLIRLMQEKSWILHMHVSSYDKISMPTSIVWEEYDITRTIGVVAKKEANIYKRTLDSDLQKML